MDDSRMSGSPRPTGDQPWFRGRENLVILLALLCLPLAMLLPVATPPNAMVFATGRIRQRDMLRAGLVLDLVSLAALTLLAWWLF